MKWYISLCNRAILTKTRRISFILLISNIKRANLNFQNNGIIDLTSYLGLLFKHHFDGKNDLYVAKKVVGLQITYNRSVMTQTSVLTTGFHNRKTDLIISVICKSIYQTRKGKKRMTWII